MASSDSKPAAPTKAEREAALARAVADLSPEEAKIFHEAVALSEKKRRLLMVGYLTAALCVLFGTAWAFYLYGQREPGSGAALWVFLIPFASAGASLMVFGRLARHIRS